MTGPEGLYPSGEIFYVYKVRPPLFLYIAALEIDRHFIPMISHALYGWRIAFSTAFLRSTFLASLNSSSRPVAIIPIGNAITIIPVKVRTSPTSFPGGVAGYRSP